jgi:Fusaric acid resistance protein-like
MPVKVAKELIDTEWSGFAPGSATRALPAILLSLAIAVATNHPVAGAIIAAGAMPLGVAYVLRPPLRASAMVLASLGMGLSALVGTLAGHSNVAIVLVATAWSLCCRLLWPLGANASWIAQQCVLNVLVASGFRGTARDAVIRAGLIFGGGLLQAIVAKTSRQLRQYLAPTGLVILMQTTEPRLRADLRLLGANLTLDSEACRYALGAALTIALATTIYVAIGLQDGFWIPMIVVIVLREKFHATLIRGLALAGGTLAGAWLTTFLTAELRPGPIALAIMIIISVWL